MSREIKFRAWDKDEKRMLEVYRIGFDGPIDGAQVYCYLDDRGAKGSKECFYDGDGLTLEQYTGLKDANGKEIYEGDVLKFKILFSDDNYEVGQVTWSNQDAGFVLECFNLRKFALRAEIVGNVHENLELLEESNE